RVAATAILVEVIGDIRREIGPRAIGFLERPVDLIAKLRSPKQELRARLPIVGQLALGRLENTGIDETTVFQNTERLVDRARRHQRLFRRETGEMEADRSEVVADQRHHLGPRELAQRLEPYRLRLAEPALTIALEQS